jgi:hypothetical protein
MKSRRHFLKEVCPTVAFAFFGLSFLEACSSGDDDVASTSSGTGNGSNVGGGNDSSGFTVDGNTYTIDLTNSNFSNISTVGGWMNGKEIGIPALFLRISSTEIQAYTNVCPHQGHTDWTYNNNKFKCSRTGANHGREYDDNCSSALTCYNPSLDGNTLTLTI